MQQAAQEASVGAGTPHKAALWAGATPCSPRRISKKETYLRLQRILLCCQLRLKIPMLRWRMPGLFWALPGKKENIYPGHHWEIGSCKETKRSRVRSVLQESFKVNRDFALKWNPYHHFFHLTKR